MNLKSHFFFCIFCTGAEIKGDSSLPDQFMREFEKVLSIISVSKINMDLKRSKSSRTFDFEMIIMNVHVRKSSQPYFPTVDYKSKLRLF